jgi:hypothetical protein
VICQPTVETERLRIICCSNDGVGELATPIKRQFVSFHKMEPAGTFENASETTSVVSSPLTLDSLEVDYPDKLVIDDVRITPSYMIFENAYEGKHYRQNMVIQNCGKHLAFIRLGEPNSRVPLFLKIPLFRLVLCRPSSSDRSIRACTFLPE